MNDATDAIKKSTIHLFLQPSANAKNAYFYALETAYLETKNDYSAILSAREAFLFFFVNKGEGILTYQDHTCALRCGDLLLLDCRESYSLQTTDPNGWTIFFLYFNGKQADGNYSIINESRKIPVYRIKNDSMVTMLLWQIITLHKEQSPQAEAITSVNITKLLTELILYNQSSAFNAFYPSCVHYVFHYVAHNYNQKITLDKLAEISAVSKFHLSREFKKYTGMTISEYIIVTRINQAKTLLRHSDKSIKQIALEVGFPLPSHFTRIFHERENMTPGTYRNQWIK